MIKKIYIPVLALVFLAMMSVSCIYPFTPESEDGSGALVIEGDILIGKETVISVSRTAPISDPDGYKAPPAGKVWVENDAGAVFNGVEDPKTPGRYTVDTRSADTSPNYCLHFLDSESGKEYVSAWERVCSAPVIDSLSYNLDYDRSKLNIALSMHALKESYFKWSYVEDWEYHSLYYSQIKFIPIYDYVHGIRTIVDGRIEKRDYYDNIYACYKHGESTQIMTFSTENQTDDRFVDLEFLPIPRDDFRISYLYKITVDLEPLTKDAYLYWENIKGNSEYNGNLFAPNPSELVGNIRCLQEPDEMVMGYVNVAQIARKDLVVSHLKANFYMSSEPVSETASVLLDKSQYVTYFVKEEYLPYNYYMFPGNVNETYWAPARCVDCKLLGGTYERPEGWPPVED